MNATRSTWIPRATRAGLLLLAAALSLVGGCEQNTQSPFLRPTGRVVDGDTEVFTSAFDVIQLLGTLNNWDETTPSMDLVGNGLWGETRLVQAGSYIMKLRTDGAWDVPADFGCCDETCGDPVLVTDDGAPVQVLVCARSGPGDDIEPVEFPVTGQYEFVLDENAGTLLIRSVGAPVPLGGISGTVTFANNPAPLPVATVSVRTAGTPTEVATAATSVTDGMWSVDGLAAGSYDLHFTATGYTAAQTLGVVVTPPGTTTAPPVAMTPLPIGSLAGVVSFIGNPSPRPVATVRVYRAGTQTQVGAGASGSVAGAYAVNNLLAGTYDVRFTAADYKEQIVTGVVIAAQQATPLNVTMQLDCSTTVQIVGDFNGWSSSAPAMSVTGPCTFADTLSIAAGCYRLKLRTDNDWDETPDFGRCSGTVGTCQIAVNPIQIVPVCAGVGLADAIGEVNFVNAGRYYFEFEFDFVSATRDGQLFIAYLGP